MNTHTTFVSRVVAPGCALGLVVASAGFGACYAARVGSEHGVLLASLSVIMALALEGIKPLAISNALQAFGRFAFLRGGLLLVLGMVAVAYSLTSELALMAGSRGDMAAHRSQQVDQLAFAKERYDRSKQELASLKPARTQAELEPLIANCRSCPGLEAELGRAKRRQDLELVMLGASADIMKSPGIATADPASTALQVYFATLGIRASSDTIASWLTLIPVLALEVGSALAGLLVMPRVTPSVPHVPEPREPTIIRPNFTALSHLERQALERDKVAGAILEQLKSHGTILGSHRSLAKQLGADRNTVGRALNGLASAGVIALDSTKQGSVLRLT